MVPHKGILVGGDRGKCPPPHVLYTVSCIRKKYVKHSGVGTCKISVHLIFGKPKCKDKPIWFTKAIPRMNEGEGAVAHMSFILCLGYNYNASIIVICV